MTTTSPKSTRREFFGRILAPALAVAVLAGTTGITATPAEASSYSYNKGFADGKRTGMKHGYSDGYKRAYKASYRDAITQPRIMAKSGGQAYAAPLNWAEYVQGYKHGYKVGYKLGYKSGSNDGSSDGYNDGSNWRDNMRDQMRECMQSGNCN